MYDDADSSSAHINKSNKKYDATWIRENQRDANKNRPGHPNYDPTTLYVPPEIEKNFTPALVSCLHFILSFLLIFHISCTIPYPDMINMI